jgi:hypothetical protein
MLPVVVCTPDKLYKSGDVRPPACQCMVASAAAFFWPPYYLNDLLVFFTLNKPFRINGVTKRACIACSCCCCRCAFCVPFQLKDILTLNIPFSRNGATKNGLYSFYKRKKQKKRLLNVL